MNEGIIGSAEGIVRGSGRLVFRLGILGDPNDVHVRRWARGLSARGVRVSIVCGRVPPEREAGIDYVHPQVPTFGLRRLLPQSLRHRRAMQALFAHFDVVHMHNVHHWGIDAGVASSARFVVSAYGQDVIFPEASGDGDGGRIDEHVVEMKREALRLADAVTATSSYLADVTAEFAGLARERVHVVHFGADVAHFSPRAARPGGRPVVGFCGGFRSYKGAPVLIDAAAQIVRRVPACGFILYGNGGNRAELEARVAREGLAEHFVFRDFVPHERLPEAMAEFDVCVAPSTLASESYGVVGIEAQAMGVPVVASRIGGLPETVRQGETGLLVKPGSAAALADGVCALLQDDERRRRMGQAAREWVMAHHNWQDSLDQMLRVYEGVLGPAYAGEGARRQCCGCDNEPVTLST